MKRYRIILILQLFCAYSFSQSFQGVNDVINNWANSDALRQAHVGISIHDVTEGYQIAGFNHDKLLIPASSLKVLTNLVTLKELGDNFVFKTMLSYEGQITDSILFGNVYIIGSGDPSLGTKRFSNKPTFQELLSLISFRIKNLGIKKIEGDVIVDESVFDSYPISPSWQWNDLGSGYGCGVWGVNINENEYTIWYNTNKNVGEFADILSMVPMFNDLEISNEVIVDTEDTGDKSYIYGDPFGNKKRIVGTLPQSREAYDIAGSIPNPPKALATAVQNELKLKNIESRNIQVHTYKKRNDFAIVPIDSITSNPLIDLVKQANYWSLNMYSEAFLKLLGYKKAYRGSSTLGINHIKSYLASRAIDYTGLNMEDGSGLSARNLITPQLLSRFLSSYAKENGFDYTASLLPEVGSEGTVRRLLKNEESKGKVWMKSGSMNQVMTYTGLMKAKSGRWVSFSIMVNAYTMKPIDMRKMMERVIDGIYKTV